MSVNEGQISKEKKLTLLLLCWLFGILGVHRFYTGKYLTGGVQLLAVLLGGLIALFKIQAPATSLLLIFPLWWIVDIMRIIMGKFTDREGSLIVDWV